MSRRVQVAALAVLLWLMPSATLLAEYRDDYRAGLAAFAQRDWPGVEAAMRAALAERPGAGGRVELDDGSSAPYLPYYYLGLARHQQGDCRSALEAWQQAEEQGAVRRSADELALLQRFREQCEAALDRFEASPPPPPPPPPGPSPEELLASAREEAAGFLERAETLTTDLSARREDPALARVFEDAELLAELDAAIGAVQQARAQLDVATVAELPAVQGLVERGPELVAELERLQGEIETRREALPPEVETLPVTPVATPTTSPVATPTPSPSISEPPPLPSPSPSATPVEAESSSEAEPATAVRAAVDTFLAGDYARVLETLPQEEPRDRQVAFTAHLLRAAARHALFLEGGGSDEVLLAAAREDVLECRRLRPAVEPPAAFFSPPFRAFFGQP